MLNDSKAEPLMGCFFNKCKMRMGGETSEPPKMFFMPISFFDGPDANWMWPRGQQIKDCGKTRHTFWDDYKSFRTSRKGRS